MKTEGLKLTEVKVAKRDPFFDLAENVDAEQMQRIAQRNGLESHAREGEVQDMAGMTVTVSDLWPWAKPDKGVEHIEALASRVGAVIQHPKKGIGWPYTHESYFQFPKITPHKGGRTISRSTSVTPATQELLEKLSERGVSLGDLVEWGAKHYNA